MQPWQPRMMRLPSTHQTTIKLEDLDDLMDGLSAPRLQDDAVIASYILNDEPDEDFIKNDNRRRHEYSIEIEETKTILSELHRDPLQELDDYYLAIHQETRQLTNELSDDETASLFLLSVDTAAAAARQYPKEQHFDDEESVDFGDFQSASIDVTDIDTFQRTVDEPGSIAQVLTTPTHAMMDNKNEKKHWVADSLVDNDDENIFVSPSDTCDIERQVDEMLGPLASCRSFESLDTPDLLAQAEAVVHNATLQQLQEQSLTLVQTLPPAVVTPMRSSSREDSGVSPPSAQIRRQQTLLPSKEMNDTKLSLRLPVDDLSDLRGRFTHRRQKHFHHQALSPRNQIITESIEDLGLPEFYFKSRKTDDTVRILLEMPWEYLNQWDEWDNAITQRLCNLDGALERVQAESLRALAPLRKHLECANHDIHDAEQSFRLAIMYWERSNDAVEAAHSGWQGYQTYREEVDERECLKHLDGVLQRLECLITECQGLVHDIEHFMVDDPMCVREYELLVDQKQKLQCALTDLELENVVGLEETKRKVNFLAEMFRARLFTLLQRLVARSLRGKHDQLWEEYSRLIKLLELVTDDTEREAGRWAETIFKAMLFELDRCLAVALVEPEAVGVSKYDSELRRLYHNVNDNSGDSTIEVSTVAQNLAIIRFNLEAEKRCLPRVVRTLCKLLVTCLYRFRLFLQWHRRPVVDMGDDEQSWDSLPNDLFDGSPFHTSIVKLLEERHTDLWEATLSVYTRCFEEYLKCSPSRSLFKRKKNRLDDSHWKIDLIDLFECVSLTERMINLKDQVCGENIQCASVHEAEQTLRHHVANIIRRHLRIVHVEAMNSLGRTLSKENWSLVMFSNQNEPETTGRPSKNAFSLIQQALEAALDHFPGSSLQREVDQRWKFTRDTCSCRFTRIVFAIPCSDEEPNRTTTILPSATTVARGTAVEVFLDGIIRSCDDEPRLASSSLCQDIFEWFGRLSAIMSNLKLVTDDVAAVFANISDLYITTVLRICSGSKTTESIILGADLPSAFVFPKFQMDFDEGASTKSTALFGSFRKRTTLLTRRIFNTALPTDLHADICYPLPNEQESLRGVREFIFRAQNGLEDIVNLDMVDPWLNNSFSRAGSLEERACLSAQILMKREAAIMSFVVLSYVVALTVDNANRPQEELKAFQAYARLLLQIALPLSAVARKISTVRSINCTEIVKDILMVGDGWDESKLHENANGYVDEVSDLCALVWGYLNASGKMPEPLQATIWHNILHMVYVSLVEGFSRVTYCSTEGRALMSLDTACLSANLNRNNILERCSNVVLADPPPEPNTNVFHRTHVDSYIKAFYLPVNDAIQWIMSNASMFHLNHCISLIVTVAQASHKDPSQSREATVRQLVEEVKLIYRQCIPYE